MDWGPTSPSLIVRKYPQYDTWSLIISSRLEPREGLALVSIAMLNSESQGANSQNTTQRNILAVIFRRLVSIWSSMRGVQFVQPRWKKIQGFFDFGRFVFSQLLWLQSLPRGMYLARFWKTFSTCTRNGSGYRFFTESSLTLNSINWLMSLLISVSASGSKRMRGKFGSNSGIKSGRSLVENEIDRSLGLISWCSRSRREDLPGY